MGRVGETERVASYLQRGELPYFEVAYDAQVHVEEARTPELIAVGIPIMCGCGIFGIDFRGCERAGIKVRARGSAHGATHAGAWLFATELAKGFDEIGSLPRTVCIQVTACADCERETAHRADNRIDKPAT